MPMAGFDRRTSCATGVLDDLYVSTLAIISDDGQPFLLCAFDLLGVDRAFCEGVRAAIAKQLGIEDAYIWVSATHTHSAPSGIFLGRENYCAEYVAAVHQASCRAAAEALRTASKSSAAIAVVTAAGIASLRDRPREQSQYQMPVLLLRFESAEQHTTLCRFACHATVLDERNTLYSRDLPGAAEDALRDGGKFLFLNGACADLSTRYTREGSTPETLLRMGQRMASAIEQVKPEPSVNFGRSIRSVRQTLRVMRGGSLHGAERDAMLTILHKRKNACSDTAAARELDAKIAVLERPAVESAYREVDISAVDLGPLILLGLPFEVSSKDGSTIEAELSSILKKPVYVVCYTGGYDGYLPSGAPLHVDSSYSDFASRYAPQVREQILQCAKRCLANLLPNE